MATTTTIFDIPLILDIICDNLSPSDIWNCYRCCNTWMLLYDSYRCRNVQYAYLDSSQSTTILQNCHQIRDLKVDLADARYFLETNCINLRNLLCVNFGYTDSATSIDPSSNALELVGRNTKLQSLSVIHRTDTQAPHILYNSILKTLSNHTSLKAITLNIRLPWETTRKLLCHLPPNLEALTLKTHYYVSQHSNPADRLLPLELERPTVLRRIAMLDEMCSPQHYFLPSLLKHCPELEEISIPYYDGGCREISEILKTHCPKLRALNQGVYISPFYEFTISQLLANAFPNGIQRLILGKVLKPSQNRQHRLLHVLANSPSVNTLEILEMKYSPADIGGDVLRILQLCPKLKELRLSADSQTLAAAADISDLVSTPSVPWKCQDSLQVLELDVSNQKEELLYKKNKIRSVLQQRTAQLVKELFRKLQSIHNLRILNLNWKSSSFQSDAMPLEIGLAYINDAWSETESTIVNMTKSDLTWIGLNWKTLDEIRQVKEMKKMKQAAARCRTDFIKNNLSNDRERISIYQDEELDQDWSLSTNQKRSGKSRIMCNRKTMKNNLAWIQKRS